MTTSPAPRLLPQTREAIIGEVSMANDDFNDNFYVNPAIGRFPEIEEDEAPIGLCWEAQKNGCVNDIAG